MPLLQDSSDKLQFAMQQTLQGWSGMTHVSRQEELAGKDIHTGAGMSAPSYMSWAT